jgi:hypothetical protein
VEVVFYGLGCWQLLSFFFYERKMGKESGSGHWIVFIVVVMVCI